MSHSPATPDIAQVSGVQIIHDHDETYAALVINGQTVAYDEYDNLVTLILLKLGVEFVPVDGDPAHYAP